MRMNYGSAVEPHQRCKDSWRKRKRERISGQLDESCFLEEVTDCLFIPSHYGQQITPPHPGLALALVPPPPPAAWEQTGTLHNTRHLFSLCGQ